jgi:hypothetical protein
MNRLNVLQLDSSHLLPKYSDAGLSTIELKMFTPEVMPAFYYANFVVYVGNNLCRILKSPLPGDKYFWVTDKEEYINLITETYESGQLNSAAV